MGLMELSQRYQCFGSGDGLHQESQKCAEGRAELRDVWGKELGNRGGYPSCLSALFLALLIASRFTEVT